MIFKFLLHKNLHLVLILLTAFALSFCGKSPGTHGTSLQNTTLDIVNRDKANDSSDDAEKESLVLPTQILINNLEVSKGNMIDFDINYKPDGAVRPSHYTIFRWHTTSEQQSAYEAFAEYPDSYFQNSNLENGEYQYQVRAHFASTDETRESPRSEIAQINIENNVEQVPNSNPIINNLKILDDEKTIQFDIGLEKTSPNFTSFTVYRYIDDASGQPTIRQQTFPDLSSGSFKDDNNSKGLAAGTYRYQVKAIFDQGDSTYGWSESKTIAPKEIPFEAPTHEVSLEWIDSDSYTVRVKSIFSDTTYLDKAMLSVKNNYIPSSPVNDISQEITKPDLENSTWLSKPITLPTSGSYAFTIEAHYTNKGASLKNSTVKKQTFPIHFNKDLESPKLSYALNNNSNPGDVHLYIKWDTKPTNLKMIRIEKKASGTQFAFVKNIAVTSNHSSMFFHEESGLEELDYTYKVSGVYDIAGTPTYGPPAEALVKVKP